MLLFMSVPSAGQVVFPLTLVCIVQRRFLYAENAGHTRAAWVVALSKPRLGIPAESELASSGALGRRRVERFSHALIISGDRCTQRLVLRCLRVKRLRNFLN